MFAKGIRFARVGAEDKKPNKSENSSKEVSGVPSAHYSNFSLQLTQSQEHSTVLFYPEA